MPKPFRESKYLNESGSKTGNWYMNRIDYFQFYEYPKYKLHKMLSLVLGIIIFIISIKVMKANFLLSLPLYYASYVALLTFNLLRTRTCRYRGYFLYPNKIINFFKEIEVEVDLNDYDSVATLNDK